MANAGNITENPLQKIIECPICLSTFTDPRMLPCIHTFCFECLNLIGNAAHKKPGEKMPCPMCQKEFIVPEDGMHGVQKNFFMETLLECKTALQVGSDIIICDMCNIRNDGITGRIPKATMRCLECQDNYCESCVKDHRFQKVSKDHQMANIGSDVNAETKRVVSMKSCTKHTHNLLNYYCAECKKIVCVSCFVESHKLHDCKDVTTVDEEFRQTIEKRARKILSYVDEMLIERNKNEKRKEDFLTKLVVTEKEIYKRNQELKDMIERHTKSVFDELYVIKSKHLNEMETRLEEIDMRCTILRSFDAYCTELRSKGSASDICSSVDQLIVRADELERDQKTFFGCPQQSTEFIFHARDLGAALQKANNNFVGTVQDDLLSIELVSSLETGTGNSIWGVTYLKNLIYLLCKNSRLILAFDAEVPFRMVKTIPVPQIESPQDMAACEKRNRLYVVDECHEYVWKVTCTQITVNRWLSGIGDPFKISVTKGGGVLIPREGNPCTIELIRSDARLGKKIELPDEIKDVEYALQSDSETLIILYGRSKGMNSGILEISMDGVALKTHSLNREVLSKMIDPLHMTLCRGDRLLVADYKRDRVIAFDRQLQAKQILLNRPRNKTYKPCIVCYIEDRKYLIVVHDYGPEVVVYKCC